MCGRYSNETEFSQIRLLFQAGDQTFRPWTPKYNISPSSGPGYEQLIVTADRAGSRQARLARFWLIPSFWSKPLSLLPTSFNARSEDLGRRPLWREPYAHTRCLVPATGWREFVGNTRPKQPYHFRPQHELPGAPPTFAFAGLWSSWTSPDGEVVDSFSILTTEPSEAAARIHDRMPLLLPSELHQAWLTDDAGRDQVLALGQSHTRALALEIFPSDPIANNVHYEGSAATRPAEPPSPALTAGEPQEPPRQLSLLDSRDPPAARPARRRS